MITLYRAVGEDKPGTGTRTTTVLTLSVPSIATGGEVFATIHPRNTEFFVRTLNFGTGLFSHV